MLRRHFASKGGAKATSAAAKKAAAAASAAAATPVAAGSGDQPRPSGPRDPRWHLARLRNPKADPMELLTEEQTALLKKLAEITPAEGGPEGERATSALFHAFRHAVYGILSACSEHAPKQQGAFRLYL